MSRVNRIIVIVLDSVGIGEAPDANLFGDVGSHTLGNVARVSGGLDVPNLEKMGLANIAILEGVIPQVKPTAAYGKLMEVSPGKDTLTGHWELMGLQLKKPFPVYPDGFPIQLIQQFERQIGRKTLGNIAASGTAILEAMGGKHMQTGKPIVYTSADSVLQIAAHEDIIPVVKLYEICQIARDLLRGEHAVGRVIARPFVGTPDQFIRTSKRRDFALLPPDSTVLDLITRAGLMVIGVGKISDIFSGRGITDSIHTESNTDGIDKTITAIQKQRKRGLIFTNLVDFDSKFGHRNDPKGYSLALSEFDRRLPDILQALQVDDVLVLTGDHGNDPTTPSTDHSREYVPILISGPPIRPGMNIGIRTTFADLAATIADMLCILPLISGKSFKSTIV